MYSSSLETEVCVSQLSDEGWDDPCETSAVSDRRRGKLIDALVYSVVSASRSPLTESELADRVQSMLDHVETFVGRDRIRASIASLNSDDILSDGLGRFYSEYPPKNAFESLDRLEETQARAQEIAEIEWPDDSTEGKPRRALLSRPHLERDQEARLAVRVSRGEVAAREEMIERNLRLVWSVVKRNAWRETSSYDSEDMFQEGCVGLMRAVDKFDPGRGFKLSTYAMNWIQQSIQRSCADKSRVVRHPVHVVEKLNKLGRAETKLERATGRFPSAASASEASEFDEEEVVQMRFIRREVLSLDGLPDGDAERIFDSTQMSVEEIAEGLSEASWLSRFLEANLSYRETMVVNRRFGLQGDEPMTLDAIGKSLGITRERARQIQDGCEKRLSHLAHEATLGNA